MSLQPAAPAAGAAAAPHHPLAFARSPPQFPKWTDVSPVPRIDAREFVGRREAFEERALATPLVVTHAFDAEEGLRCYPTDEAFSDSFFNAFASTEVSYQRKGNARGARPRLFEGPLAEVVAGMMTESHHGDAWYLLSEDLLDTADDARLRAPLRLPPALFGRHDFFDLFPPATRPKKSCVIMGGPGARSFLHADPYAWLGLNYLFEGRKLWTFVRPSPANEAALGLQRVRPDAWDGEVGAGWKSDAVDLYHVEPRIGGGGAMQQLQLQEQRQQQVVVTLGLPPTLAGALEKEDVLACVQEEGELVVIPPRWSHQVYHLTPALALAWQICNRASLRRVLDHVLEYCREGGEEEKGGDVSALLEEIWRAPPPPPRGEGGEEEEEEEEELAWARSRIETTLLRAMELRYGKENGPREWARLKGQ
jgi:hypothetical protein